MDIKQVATLVNNATSEMLGDSAVLAENLQNVVDVGDTIVNRIGYDKYVKSLVNHIGKVIFVDRAYRGGAPRVYMDGWEFGSILEKVSVKLPEAQENESWELEDGASYDVNVFVAPTVKAKFFNKRVTFEIQMSFAEKQVKQSFSSATQLNAFVSMIYTAIENAMTVKTDALIMRTITNFIGETIYDGVGSTYTSTSIRAVNLLKLWNDDHSGSELDAETALHTPEFIRFAVYTMGLYRDRMTRLSTLFNVDGEERFTSADDLRTVLLSEFEKSARVYLYDANGQFNTDDLKLPESDIVPYWQGSGTGYAFEDTSSINITTASNHAVDVDGIIGVMFDRNALGVANLDRRVTSQYNAKGEFYNNWFKFDEGLFNDTAENFVVFYLYAES